MNQTLAAPPISSTGTGLAALEGEVRLQPCGTHAVWAGIVLLLHPVCARWNALKTRFKATWWVSCV